MPPLRIAALLTCHNRRDDTVDCLRALRDQVLDGMQYENRKVEGEKRKSAIPADSPSVTASTFNFQLSTFSIEVFLVDDGCTDGTAEAVLQIFPNATIHCSDGSLFWCRGMKKAWELAAKTDPDYYLWLNDDTHLLPGSLAQLVACASLPDDRQHLQIAVANCRDPDLGIHTYGGYKRLGSHPLILELLPLNPSEEVFADTFNGNVVLVPRAVYKAVGGMSSFAHGLGDLDYGYRVKRAGGKIVLPPGFLAECKRGVVTTYWVKGPGRKKRWKMLNDRKAGLPWWDWLRFCRAHGGILWPLAWVRPYIRVALDL